MLEELGHVTVVETEARRAHAITDAGRRDLELNQEAVRDFYERFEDEPWEVHAEDFGDAVRRMSRLFRREFRPGARRGRLTPQVMARIRAAIDDAFVKIQQALNGEDQNPERMGVCHRALPLTRRVDSGAIDVLIR